ncbi:MAG: Ig-like domain-containing protein [Bacteroidota bacterium]
MKKASTLHKPVLVVILLLFTGNFVSAQVEGLAGWKLFLDPGHSQQENMGLYNYSEAEKVLRVAFELRDMFEEQTDVGEVHLSRRDDQEQMSLEARTTLANELGVDFYYSIHSDAGDASENSTLTLYGGWRRNGVTVEKTPRGGAEFGDILHDDLSGAMRISDRGNWADRNYYLGDDVDQHEKQHSYLYVNRTTNMPSLLSEGGFHTNPEQQQKNLNAEWKKIEALSAFRSLLFYLELKPPETGIVTGIITDKETGEPANGVTVTVEDQTYTTDTYSSLFHEYSDDPGKLRNGFYWIDGLTPDRDVEVHFSSDDFEDKTVSHTVVSDPEGATRKILNHLDVELLSVVPPVVENINPASNETGLYPGDDVKIEFSRKMDRESVEQAISLTPAVDVDFDWQNDFTLRIRTSNLDYETSYDLIIDGATARNALTSQELDGNEDGEEGGDFEHSFVTAPEDTDPPEVEVFQPSENNAARVVRPVIRMVFDEEIDPGSVDSTMIAVRPADGNNENVKGWVQHMVVKEQSVVHFFPEKDLEEEGVYEVILHPGIEDLNGNQTGEMTFGFKVSGKANPDVTVMDDFEQNVSGWWKPQQSGSTRGVMPEETIREHEADIVCLTTGSGGSMKLNYGWEDSADGYIRLYLPPDAEQNNHPFGTEHILKVWLLGDGSGHDFRFVVKDGEGTYEASSWKSIDWKGWKLVEWDLSDDPVFGWGDGNGKLDGDDFVLDGFHFRPGNEDDLKGEWFFDHLHVVKGEDANHINDLSDENSIRLYPNPVERVMYVETSGKSGNIELFDQNGREIITQKIHSGRNEIDLGHLPTGIYVVQLRTEGKVYSEKVVVRP